MDNNKLENAYVQNKKKPTGSWTKAGILREIRKVLSKEEYARIKELSQETLEIYFLKKLDDNTYAFALPTNYNIDDLEGFEKWTTFERKNSERKCLEKELNYRKDVSYVDFEVEEYHPSSKWNKWTTHDGKGIIYNGYCYVLSYNGATNYSRRKIDGKHFRITETHKEMPSDCNKEEADSILKSLKIGKYAGELPEKDYCEVDHLTIDQLNFDDYSEEFGIGIMSIVRSLFSYKQGKLMLYQFLKEAKDTKRFVRLLIDNKAFRETKEYVDLLTLSNCESPYSSILRSLKWYKIRSIFGDRRFFTDSTGCYVEVGNDDFCFFVPHGNRNSHIRVAVFDDVKENKVKEDALRRLMNYYSMVKGHCYIYNYDYDCGYEQIYELNSGFYRIYYYEGLVAFVKFCETN